MIYVKVIGYDAKMWIGPNHSYFGAYMSSKVGTSGKAFFAQESHWFAQEYIHVDDVIGHVGYCWYLMNKMLINWFDRFLNTFGWNILVGCRSFYCFKQIRTLFTSKRQLASYSSRSKTLNGDVVTHISISYRFHCYCKSTSVVLQQCKTIFGSLIFNI